MTAVSLSTNGINYFPVLPKEVVLRIFGCLPSQALHTSYHVCQAWSRLINDENFPLIEWNKNKCETGNENLRRDIEKHASDLQVNLGLKITAVLKKTSNPFSDRQKIVNYILENRDEYDLSSAVWRSASKRWCLPLCEVFLPLVKGTSFLEQGVILAIQQGHVDLVKKLLTELHEERAKEKICITVEYPTKEGESLSLRGYVGAGPCDLNSWEKGYPMKKARGKGNLWEIILLPVVYGEKTYEYDPLKDNILFPFKPVLHLANGEVRMAKQEYHIKPRTDIKITPEF